MSTNSVFGVILGSIKEKLESDLSRCGFMYHIFGRVKSTSSIEKKLDAKAEMYREKNKKMQDLIGIRITLYFSDDVEILHHYLKSLPNYLEETIDNGDETTFKPKKLNLVMNVEGDWRNELSRNIQLYFPEVAELIDLTYEVQIRTIFSEGWHEVEHDLRYKCQEDWVDFKEESRLLNGIFASLENSEWSMLTLFDKMSYSFYKKKNWTNMTRNKMRIRFADHSISKEVIDLLSSNNKLAKGIFQAGREKSITQMLSGEFRFPLKYDTIIYILNRVDVKNSILASLETPTLKDELDRVFGKLV